MILTYKILHSQDFSQELEKARKIAEYAIKYRSFSSESVKYIGLKSAIANQILRKYGRNKNIKRITNVKLIIPNQSIKVNRIARTITIPCLKDKFRDLEYRFPNTFEKINQIEIGEEYAYVSINFKDKEPNLNIINNVIGIDLNTTGHVAVVSNPQTGKVWKFGKATEHIHRKYKNIRRRLQKLGKYKKVKQIKNRESRIVKDINHKISKEIVKIARTNDCGIIKLEKLQKIRQNKKYSKSFRYCLNSWSFYQFQRFVEYKAKLQGILVSYIDPRYTSRTCSRCGHIGNRNDKRFECHYCGHVDHADVNASFNIGKPISHCIIKNNMGQFNTDRIDVLKGSTDTPKKATQKMIETLELHTL